MADVPFELEGPVTDIKRIAADHVELTVMGIKVNVNDQFVRKNPVTNLNEPIPVLIKTPTRLITLEELADKSKFDHRTEDGFMNATAIVEGAFDDAISPRVYRAFGVEIEPAENLILGELTNAVNAEVNGVKIHKIQDAQNPAMPLKRMLFKGPSNEFGFLVTLNASLMFKPASSEGYYASTAKLFCAHMLEVDSSAPLDPGEKRMVTLLRSRSRERPGGPATVDFRGGVRMPAGTLNTLVHVYRVDPKVGQDWVKDHDAIVASGKETFLGEIPISADGAFPGFGLWRLKGPLDAANSINLTPPRYIRVMRMTSATLPPKEQHDEGDTDLRLA